MQNIKEKLRQWLGIVELLRSHKSLFDQMKVIEQRVDAKLNHNEGLIKAFLASCSTGYDLETSKYHKNWCVFAAQGRNGRPDFVQFIDLSHLSLEEIWKLDKQLQSYNENRNVKYDAPRGLKNYFLY